MLKFLRTGNFGKPGVADKDFLSFGILRGSFKKSWNQLKFRCRWRAPVLFSFFRQHRYQLSSYSSSSCTSSMERRKTKKSRQVVTFFSCIIYPPSALYLLPCLLQEFRFSVFRDTEAILLRGGWLCPRFSSRCFLFEGTGSKLREWNVCGSASSGSVFRVFLQYSKARKGHSDSSPWSLNSETYANSFLFVNTVSVFSLNQSALVDGNYPSATDLFSKLFWHFGRIPAMCLFSNFIPKCELSFVFRSNICQR